MDEFKHEFLLNRDMKALQKTYPNEDTLKNKFKSFLVLEAPLRLLHKELRSIILMHAARPKLD